MLSAIGAPDAIAATINSFPTMAASPIAGTDVASWININGTRPQELSARIRSDYELWAKVVRTAGVKLE